MPRKKETLTLSVPPGTKEQLETIARRLKIFWGKSPSPSGLVAAIAQSALEVGTTFTLNTVQIAALRQGVRDLIDAGHTEEAQVILGLLLERGNLPQPLRQEILRQIGHPSTAWRTQLEQQIKAQQPFRLLYLDAQEKAHEFTVHYAEIRPRERRLYLEIWCEEIDEDQIPELAHNRSLRLDRIQRMVILNTIGEWRSGLDTIKVQLHFLRGMVKAYETKIGDEDIVVGDIRRVVREVSSTFWLFREIAPYMEDCIIVAPEAVRERFKEKARLMYEQYGL